MPAPASEADAFSRMVESLNAIGESPGWIEIHATAGAPQESGVLSAIHTVARTIRPVRAAAVERSLEDAEPGAASRAVATIANTVGFAKNVLEAERDAHNRAAIHGLDIADMTRTGPHAAVKARAKGEGEAEAEAATRVAGILEARQALPFKERGSLFLADGIDEALFYGLAELYGMARANYQPAELIRYLVTSDVRGLNHRTATFLRHSGQIAEVLAQAHPFAPAERLLGPVERLHNRNVEVPVAMKIADSPTENTVLAAALDLSRRAAEARPAS